MRPRSQLLLYGGAGRGRCLRPPPAALAQRRAHGAAPEPSMAAHAPSLQLHQAKPASAARTPAPDSCSPALLPPLPARAPPAVGWLLPWALQQLSRGDKDCPGAAAAEQLSGELRTGQQHSAWFLHRAARRRRRLHEALMGDDQLKVVLMEQQWWAQGDDFEAGCADCGCSPSDLRPAYDCTGESV